MGNKNVPHQLDHWARNVDATFQQFQSIYGGDTSGWIVADTGGNSALANEAIRLKNTGTGNFADQGGDGRLARGEAKLHAMGQSTGIQTDTGGQKTA